MLSVLDFVNGIRALQRLDQLSALALLGTDPDDEANCVLAHALGCCVGASADPDWEREGFWVMRFEDRLTARLSGLVTGQAWLSRPAELQLPDALVDLVVAHHYGLVEPDELGLVAGWWVPDGDNLACRTPAEKLIPRQLSSARARSSTATTSMWFGGRVGDLSFWRARRHRGARR